MDLASGTLVDGKYRVVRLLGRGGMGAVYEAENVRIHKTVAMKVLAAGAAEDVVRRFEKEAQAAGRIGSEHIVEVHDLGTMPSGEPYMVMEYLDGETLRSRLHRDRTLTVEAALPLLVQLLEGLGAAHAAGIVHRDLKPENVYLLKERGGLRDWVKILDFGISKFASVTEDGMTKTGQVIGTPQYMAPEQIKAPQLVDGRTDLYAVGVIFYQLLTGAIPFKAKTYAELLFKIVYEPLPHPATLVPDLDASYAGRAACEILLKAMSRDPEQRYASASAMRDALLELGGRIGAPLTGETTGTTRAFMRATGHAMPIAPGLAAFDPRGSGRHEAMTPAPSVPSVSGAGWPLPAPEIGFGRAPAPTQLLTPQLRPDGSATPHPGLAPTPFPSAPGLGPGSAAMPTPNPSFGGVPVATHAPPAGDAGRKAAVAIGAGILAVTLGVVGFLVTRPSGDAPVSGAAGSPVTAAVEAPVAPPVDPPVDTPPAAPDVSAEPTATAAPPTSASAPATPAAPRPHGDAPPRPKGPPRPPAPKSTSVLGY